MKTNKFFLSLFFLTILLSGCEEELTKNSFQLGIEEDFHLGELNNANSYDLQFTITDINDSRCPSDVQCVWEGEAVVKIKMESPEEALLELSTFDNQSDTIGSIVFHLIDVSPYPVSTQSIPYEDYDVTLKIENL